MNISYLFFCDYGIRETGQTFFLNGDYRSVSTSIRPISFGCNSFPSVIQRNIVISNTVITGKFESITVIHVQSLPNYIS